MIVDFFVAGVQKGGTTALDRMLRYHPNIRMARVKEPHFFDDDSVDWSRPDFTRYHAQFDVPNAAIAVVGEATPILSYWPCALERIAAYNPTARIILCLRHPSLRAYSQWRMETSRQAEDLSFADAIREPGRYRVRTAPGGVHRVFSYVERGFYARQIERLQKLFPPQNLFFIRTDRLWSDAKAAFRDILDFLAVPQITPTDRRYDVWIDTRDMGPMQRSDRRYLDMLYAEDIRHTARRAALDLSDWLEPNYEEPMDATAATDE